MSSVNFQYKHFCSKNPEHRELGSDNEDMQYLKKWKLNMDEKKLKFFQVLCCYSVREVNEKWRVDACNSFEILFLMIV